MLGPRAYSAAIEVWRVANPESEVKACDSCKKHPKDGDAVDEDKHDAGDHDAEDNDNEKCDPELPSHSSRNDSVRLYKSS